MKTIRLAAVLGLVISAGACAGDEAAAREEAPVAVAADAAAPAAAPAALPAGNVTEVRMVMDAKGNYFEPTDVTVKRGDVVRFVLVSGVHNVSFPADKNAGLSGLPASSPYLATPGQSFDLAVDMEPGTYTFQCDPHVPMGMVGTLTVQ